MQERKKTGEHMISDHFIYAIKYTAKNACVKY